MLLHRSHSFQSRLSARLSADSGWIDEVDSFSPQTLHRVGVRRGRSRVWSGGGLPKGVELNCEMKGLLNAIWGRGGQAAPGTLWDWQDGNAVHFRQEAGLHKFSAA